MQRRRELAKECEVNENESKECQRLEKEGRGEKSMCLT